MRIRIPGPVLLLAVALALPVVTTAGPLDSLKGSAAGALGSSGKTGGGLLDGGGLAGTLGGGSLGLGSMQNVAGIMGWCQSHGYAPSASEMVKDRLLDKLGLDNRPDETEDYQQGVAGILKDAKGGQVNLSSLRNVAGKQACSTIADEAMSSMLGI